MTKVSIITAAIYPCNGNFTSKIREDQNIKELKVNGEELKLKSYTDYVILTMSNPQNLTQHVMEQMKTLILSLVFKNNKRKTKIIPKFLIKQEGDDIKTITGCDPVIKPIKYQGINVSENRNTLFLDNYEVTGKNTKIYGKMVKIENIMP